MKARDCVLMIQTTTALQFTVVSRIFSHGQHTSFQLRVLMQMNSYGRLHKQKQFP